MTSRRHLIIQGPLISEGHSGRTRGTTFETVTFDCRPQIRRIAKAYAEYFDRIVLVTWDDAPDFPDPPENLQIVRCSPQGLPSLQRQRTRIRPQGADNLFRIYYSTLAGLEALDIDERDPVVRIRTDQEPDLAVLARAADRIPPGRIGIPCFQNRDSYPLLDFYFAAMARDLRWFVGAVLADGCRVHFAWAHLEPIFKTAHALAETDGIDSRACFVRPLAGKEPVGPKWLNRRQREIARYMYRTRFQPLPFDAFASIRWRGDPLNDRFVEHHRRTFVFAENFEPSRLAVRPADETRWSLAVERVRVVKRAVRSRLCVWLARVRRGEV